MSFIIYYTSCPGNALLLLDFIIIIILLIFFTYIDF